MSLSEWTNGALTDAAEQLEPNSQSEQAPISQQLAAAKLLKKDLVEGSLLARDILISGQDTFINHQLRFIVDLRNLPSASTREDFPAVCEKLDALHSQFFMESFEKRAQLSPSTLEFLTSLQESPLMKRMLELAKETLSSETKEVIDPLSFAELIKLGSIFFVASKAAELRIFTENDLDTHGINSKIFFRASLVVFMAAGARK